MNFRRTLQFACPVLLLLTLSAAAEDFTNAIQAFLQHRGEVEKKPGGIVIGLADEHGTRIVSWGRLNNDSSLEVNGDTVFALHSGTCQFTALLLQDLIERGEMKLDDPVEMYLPQPVTIPSYNGKQITLRHLVTETAGLPDFAAQLPSSRANDPFADYTVERMYGFLSNHKLEYEPGVYYGHGGVAMGLLGNAIALKAGTNYESLVLERICRPLQMNSTRITLTPELKSRLITEYNPLGYPTMGAEMNWGALAPLAGLHSTVHDLLRFVSALGQTPSSLTPLLEKTLVYVPSAPQGNGVFLFGAGGCDKARRRSVVVMAASVQDLNLRHLRRFLLESEWESDRRPKETRINIQVYGMYAGQYERSPDLALGLFALRQFLGEAPRAAVYVSAGFGLALLVFFLWRAATVRKRWLILGGAVLAGGLLGILAVLSAARAFCARFHPAIGVHKEGDRLFAQPTGQKLWPIADWDFADRMYLNMNPIDVWVPPVRSELLPESETRFFERLSGMPMIFYRNGRGKVTRLMVYYQGKGIAYNRVSDQPPAIPEPPKPLVATRLDTKLLDACVGQYELAPNTLMPAGAQLTIWREGEHLVWQAFGEKLPKLALEMYAESETNFFIKLDGAQVTFIKNDKGEVTSLTHHLDGYPFIQGRKLSDPPK